MANEKLDNLVKTKQLQLADSSEVEIANLIRMGTIKLNDARHADLDAYSKFDLAYNAAYALAMAALWRAGYRSNSRYLVFQCTQHTLDLEAEHWRI